MEYFKGHSVPGVPDQQSFTGSQGQEKVARTEIETFMEHCHCAKRRLLPDVRDPPEQGTANVDMMDI